MSVFATFLNWKVFVDTLPLLLKGLWITIGLGVSAIVLGAAGGLLLALLRLYAPAPVRLLAISYINVFRAIPILVLLIVIYYAPAVRRSAAECVHLRDHGTQPCLRRVFGGNPAGPASRASRAVNRRRRARWA